MACQFSIVVLVWGLIVCGCGDDGGGKASGAARILQGPRGTNNMFRVQTTAASATDGQWLISPNQGRATLVGVSFMGAVQGTSTTASLGANCTVAYTRGAAALSEIVSCPFDVDPGTYLGVSLEMSSTMELLVDDPINSIYSDPGSPTLFSATAPSGGAQFVPYTIQGGQPTVNFGYALTEPLVINAGDTVSLSVVADMTHTAYLQIAAGAPRFEDSFGFIPMYLFATVSDVGSAAYYTSVADAGNYNRSTLAAPQGPKGESNLRVFYGSSGQPLYIFNDHFAGNSGGSTCHSGNSMGGAFAADPATSPQDAMGNRAGGYLGKDGTGTICWAFADDTTYANYDSYFAIGEAANLADATTLKCAKRDAVPAPTSGTTYASGCPSIPTDVEAGVTLVAW